MSNNYRLTAEDENQFYELYLYAFNKQDSPARRAFFRPRYEHALTYGVKQNGQLVSGLYSLPFKVNFYGQTYKMNGIGDVMSAPEYSGHGGASTLLQAALQDMYADGVELSYLAPFSLTFYRRLGYEQTFNHTVYRMASRDLPKLRAGDDGGSVTRGSLVDMYADLAPVYARSDINHRGGLIRADWWWQYLCLKNNWDAALYRDASGAAKGYLIYNRGTSQLVVKEFVAETVAARQQLLAFIAKHRVTFSEIVYDAPDTDFLEDYFPNADQVEARIEPFMMARIVHLQNFMAKYPAAKDAKADVVLDIHDGNITANDGYWRLRAVDGNVQFTQTEATETAVQISIQLLTKILMGAQTAKELVRRGQMIATPAQIAAIDSVTVGQTPALGDYF